MITKPNFGTKFKVLLWKQLLAYAENKKIMQESTSSSHLKFLATSLNHTKIHKHDTESTRLFLSFYDQYAREIISRSQQLSN